ncbi:MAG: HAD family hydrolase [Acidimicrobiales bacterium]
MTVLFHDLKRQALIEILELSGTAAVPETVSSIHAGRSEFDLYPDIKPCLLMLAKIGIPAFALTNGSMGTVTALLARAELTRLITGVLSIEEVGPWKPRPSGGRGETPMGVRDTAPHVATGHRAMIQLPVARCAPE